MAALASRAPKVNHFKDQNMTPWWNILIFHKNGATMSKQQRELMNLRSNLIVIFHKERKSVAALCDFPIKWSHCINNTSSIQYSKCVNRGERLARRWIRPAGSHMCGMYLSLQESLCTAAYTSAMTRPITLKAPDNISAQQRSWWNDICLLRCTGTQVARPNALKLVSHPYWVYL